ncbi:MAG: MASE1 domain-containing protein [Alphaproteobacteria bacterium]|nr:MASE1 domain-containing protein [Alphaproteobacteria bacterium]
MSMTTGLPGSAPPPSDAPPSSRALGIGRVAVLAGAFLAAGLLSLELARQTQGIGSIWLMNGLVLAALFKAPARQWGVIAAAAFAAGLLADLVYGYGIASGCVFALVDLVEVFVVAVPMRRLQLDQDICDLRSLLAFMTLAFGPAIMASAIIAAAYMGLARHAPFAQSAGNWYMSDALGLIQVAPAAMLVKRSDIVDLFRRNQLLPAFASIGVLTLVYWTMITWPQLPLGFLLFPCVLVLAFQQSYAGVAAGLVLITGFILANIAYGHGFLATTHAPLRDKVLFFQFFVVVLTATMLVVTAVLYGKKKVEKQLREATQAAIEARREADKANLAKSQFLANMSHELRTPLNAILGFSEIIRDGGLAQKCTAQCPEHAAHIHSAGSHLLDLVNDILDASKIEAGKYEIHLERLDLAVAVRDAAAMLAQRASEGGVALRIEEPAGGLPALADQRAVKQILLNLMSNAVKFTPSGGSVTVSLLTEGEGAVIVVRDTGVGIPASELPRLGRPFERVRNNATRTQPGTGLGLALVRSLAELHGGTMTIESAENVGTTVRVTLRAASLAA